MSLNSMPEISVQQVAELMAEETPPLLIDCREQHEFDHCRINGSVLIPLSSFADKAESLIKDENTFAIIYCHHGVRSLHAVQYLAQQGYHNAVSMQGGIDQWSLQIDADIPRY